jgi:hypothetical protein
MKRLLLLTLLCLPLVACTPSANPPTAPPVVGTGYVDINDQHFAQAIASVQTFYVTIQNDVNARTYVPSPTELTALNALGVAINVAKSAAQNYHNSQTAANLTAATTSVNSMTSQQQTLATQIPAGVK